MWGKSGNFWVFNTQIFLGKFDGLSQRNLIFEIWGDVTHRAENLKQITLVSFGVHEIADPTTGVVATEDVATIC